MMQTSVGARCSECARLYKLPTYRISTQYYLRASGTALGMAIVCGIIWGLIERVVPLFSFNLLLAPAAGYAIGEVVSLTVNRKRGTGLAIIAGIAIVISYFITFWFFGGRPIGLFSILYHLAALALGIFITVTRIR